MRSIIVGNVGSGNSLVMSSERRDALERGGIIAVEMEGAGIAHDAQAIIVKAVSDYADGHKSKEWQGFAAIQAASAARELIILFESRHRCCQEERGHAKYVVHSSPETVSEWNSIGRTETGNSASNRRSQVERGRTETGISASDWRSQLGCGRQLYESDDFYGAFKAYEAYGKGYAARLPLNLESSYPNLFEAANRMALCLYKYTDQQSRPLLPSDKLRQELEDYELNSLQNAQDFSVVSEAYAGDRRRLIIQARLTRFIIDVRMEEKKSPGGRLDFGQQRKFVDKSLKILNPLEVSRDMDGYVDFQVTMRRLREDL